MAGDSNLRVMQIQRTEFYRNNYDFMTGVRIAATLGGFFLFVLLTLLYKSKCKKSSRDPTPIPLSTPHPDMVVLMPNPSAQPIEECMPMLNRHQQLLMDPQPGPSHYGRYRSPKVLLTTAHDSSESSIESELFMNNLHSTPSLSSHGNNIPPIVGTTYTKKKSGQDASTGTTQQMSLLQQNIDIHVIQPTPTISPSGSENVFHKESRNRSKKRSDQSHVYRPSAKHPSATSADSDSVVIGTNNLLFYLQAENLSLKYMDDTSSDNIPTRGSDLDDDSGGSLGSDSVFSFERKLSSASQSTHQDEQDQEEGELCRVTLTQAHAQVHHRDSSCSTEFESVTDYMECHRRRSSSTQTTWSDLRRCLNLGPCATANISPRSSIGGAAEDPAVCQSVLPTTNTPMLLTPLMLNKKKATIAHISSSSSPLSNSSSRKQSIVSTQDEPIIVNTTLSPVQMSSSASAFASTSSITASSLIPTFPTSSTSTSTNTPNQHANSQTSLTNSPNSSATSITPTIQQQQQQQSQQGKNTKTFQTLKLAYSVQCDDEKHLLQEYKNQSE